MKYLLQIIASIAYTCIYASIISLIVFVPAQLILGMSWWKVLLFMALGMELIEIILLHVGPIISIPYAWILKNNRTSLIIAYIITIYTLLHGLFVFSFKGTFEIWDILLKLYVAAEAIRCMYVSTKSLRNTYKILNEE